MRIDKTRNQIIRNQMVGLLPRLRRFALTLARDSDRADDLVQASCERALTRLDQLREGTRLDSWLYRIIYTQWIDRVRRRQRRSAQAESLRDLQALDEERASSPKRLISFMDVKKALGRLAQENRAAILLVAVEGYTYAEAAVVLGVPPGTVASRVARARSALAEHFQEEQPRLLAIHRGN